MRRPLFIMLTGLVLGEAFTCFCGEMGIYMMALFMFVVLIWYFCRRRFQGHFQDRMFCLVLIAGFAFFGGICAFADASLPEWKEENCEVAGRVISVKEKTEGQLQMILDQVNYSSGSQRSGFYSYRSNSPSYYGCRGKKVQKYSGKLQVYYEVSDEERPMPGDRIKISGEIRPLTGPTNKGEFDSRIWYQAQGIRALLSGKSMIITQRPLFSFRAAAWRVKERIGSIYRRVLSEEDAALLSAMALGDKTDLSEEQRLTFSENGVAHLLAVSGLHVSILGGCLFTFLKKRGAGYTISCLTGSLILIFYGCMTGFGSSAFRAIIMYLVYLLAQYIGADYDIISAMSLSGILLLTEYPKRLLEGGFQISYLSILTIGAILPAAQELFECRKLENAHNSVSTRKMQGGSISSKSGGFRSHIRQAVFSGLIIGCVMAPVLMRIFYEWSPISLILNLVLLPCMEPLMISAVCGGLAGLVLVPVGKVCLLPAQGILLLFQRIFGMTDRLPGKILITGCPAVWQLFVIYVMMTIIFFLLLYPDVIRVLSIVLLLILFITYEQAGSVSMLTTIQEAGLKIDMLDVGQGECILIRTPDRKTILIDGGSSSRDHIGRDVIIPVLKYYGVRRIDYLVVTHLDTDHTSGLTELFVRGFPVSQVLLPDAGRNDPAWIAFYNMAVSCKSHVSRISRGDQVRLGQIILNCLHPESGYEPEDRNDGSIVICLIWRQFDMLFTGDLGPEGEKNLLSFMKKEEKKTHRLNTKHRRLDVLKIPHHGSRYSTSEALLGYYPDIQAALISAGRNNHYGHPHRELLRRLKKRKISPFITKEIGAIHLVTDGKKIHIEGYLQ